MKYFQTKGDEKLLTIIDYEGNPVDVEGNITSITLSIIELETSEKKFFGQRGKTTRIEGYNPAEFSGELETYNYEITDIFLDAEKSQRPLTAQVTMEMNEITTGEIIEVTHTMKGIVVKSPAVPGQLNGSDYAVYGFMMKVNDYRLNDGRKTRHWTVKKGWIE